LAEGVGGESEEALGLGERRAGREHVRSEQVLPFVQKNRKGD
jgi:hypothetical protein